APTRDTQGAASLALGYVLLWAFSPPLLNPKLESTYSFTITKPKSLEVEKPFAVLCSKRVCQLFNF
uniref:hypothetical protein n=1 Tax=Prevotellamassilia timonensis TaxID=1852370 RepID=UPI003FEF131F